MSGGAARSHSISPAAAPPGVATAPNPWPWPAKPGLSDATAGGCRPRAAHHRCPSPPPSPATCPSRPLPALHRLSPPLALHSPPSPPPLTLCSHLHLSLSTPVPRPQILPLFAYQAPSGSSGWLEPHPYPSLSTRGPAVPSPAPGPPTCQLHAHTLYQIMIWAPTSSLSTSLIYLLCLSQLPRPAYPHFYLHL